ncbi:hypothetical protein J4Q44_G00225830 [Coregonus suidteri]|uniref:Protein tyrosine phosphatase 4A2 n=1 Tax=Coregonus suidteri TaxID=861788 RepID=A0AAN8LIU8_9TELE
MVCRVVTPPCARWMNATLLSPQRLHIYGVCEGEELWRLLPGTAPAPGHCGQMNRPAPVEITYECMKFLITHNPTNSQLVKFIEDLKAFGVQTLVRVCNATYDKTPVEQEGITVVDWPFDDGSSPPEQVVDDWLNLLKCKFREEPGCCIAVHCVAGLGRAPVLVALALIECGMEYEDAVHFIRQKRRGAINSKQLMYLENYKPKMRLRFKDANGQNCCIHFEVKRRIVCLAAEPRALTYAENRISIYPDLSAELLKQRETNNEVAQHFFEKDFKPNTQGDEPIDLGNLTGSIFRYAIHAHSRNL